MRVILLSTFAAVMLISAPVFAGSQPDENGCYESYWFWPFSDLKGQYCPTGVQERPSEPHAAERKPDPRPDPEPDCPQGE